MDHSFTGVMIQSQWLHILKAFCLHTRHEQHDTVGDAWMAITAEEFDAFHISQTYQYMSMGMQPSSSSMQVTILATSITSQLCVCDAVADFKKGVKLVRKVYHGRSEGKRRSVHMTDQIVSYRMLSRRNSMSMRCVRAYG